MPLIQQPRRGKKKEKRENKKRREN